MSIQTHRLLSAILSATTIMSMLTSVAAVATDTNSVVDDVAEKTTIQEQSSSNQQANTAVAVDDSTVLEYSGATGDRTHEKGVSDEVAVINSASEYYKLASKKYRVPSGGSLKADLPSNVDNSQSIYFPPIGDQLQVNSCVAWAQTYYQFTYEMNKSQGIATTPENTFSPKWAYNLQSFGMDFGAISDDVYNVMIGQGVAPMSLVPYDEDTTSWSPSEEVWSTALKYKLKGYQYFEELGLKDTRITSADDSDLDAIKTALSNGDVLTYSTYIASWKTTRIQADSSAPENAKYAGEEIVITQTGYEGGHRMALVGYNDNIWTDINNNCRVDDGEMGAFKAVNSWGDIYGNNGYIWIAYDALNDGSSSVDGAPDYGYKTKIFEFVARIDVQPVRDNSDMYLRCTLNTSKRSDVNVYLIADKNGTVSTEVGLATTKYQLNTGGRAFDGSKASSDATLAFALNSVIPDISSENFHEYSWSVKFVDEENNFAPLMVKEVAIVDAGENKVYKPQDFAPFTLEGEEKTVEITSSTINDIVIYYCGYYNPTLHYKADSGKWQTVQMDKNAERYGYTHKFVIPSDTPKQVTLYFTDSDGDVDDNNGKYYKTDGRYNHYVTENQAKPLFADVKMDSIPDVDKLMTYIATAEGGYAPYRYEFKLTKINDGTERIREYTHEVTVDWGMRAVGDYRITVNVKDQSNKVVTANLVFHVDDKPFKFTSLTANPDNQIIIGDTIKFTAKSEFESAIDWGATPSMYDVVIRKADTNELMHVVSKRADESDFYHKQSVNYISWTPPQAGDYTIKISSTDNNNEYAEITLDFTVNEYNGTIIGDADNNGTITLTDALLVMNYNIGAIDSSRLWLRLSDGNDDSKVDLRDAIYILKYIVSDTITANVGKVNHIEPPIGPVEKNIVTFTDKYDWGGVMNCQYWSDSNMLIEWPGEPMAKLGTDNEGHIIYSFEVPSEATYVMFTNCVDSTVEIAYSGGFINYCPTTTDSRGFYNVEAVGYF
ncbi:MAG: hypothetical protein UE295_11795 [Acutalibacteraceae bacterium]|nr:hypothetical protein [Acutalibacteraceae bacterium]